MEKLNNISNEEKIEIKNKILGDTDHNNPKIPQSKGGSFFDALDIGTDRFSKSKIRATMFVEREE